MDYVKCGKPNSPSGQEMWAFQFRERALAQALWFDNLFYQYEQGYLEPDFYEAAIRPVLVANAKRWTDAGISPGRPSFKQEVERLL